MNIDYIIHNLHETDAIYPYVNEYNSLCDEKKRLSQKNITLNEKIEAHRNIKTRKSELLTIIKNLGGLPHV